MEEASRAFFSENIDESPLKKDQRRQPEKNFKIPEFPYNENNIKTGKRVSNLAIISIDRLKQDKDKRSVAPLTSLRRFRL